MYIIINALYGIFLLGNVCRTELYVYCQLALSHTDMLLKVSSTAYIRICTVYSTFSLKAEECTPSG